MLEQSVKRQHDDKILAFGDACRELNERFMQAGANLHYHNGFIQLALDATIQEQIEQPVWSILREPVWKNVDSEMKQAIDARDTAGPDPAFHAAKALESTIQIIARSRGWPQERRLGAIRYLKYLQAPKNGGFIADWEFEILREFFTKVRNPFAHGAGSEEPARLTAAQTDWAIGFCMIWIRNLIRRM